MHNSFEIALKVARNEYCERQALTLFWYYGHCLHVTELKNQPILGKSHDRAPYINQLLKRGKIYILDISLLYPVRTILAIFLSEQGPVYYSAGAAGCEDPSMGISKALDELYQEYVLMVYLSDPGASKILTDLDPLNQGYLNFNNENGYTLINEYLKRFERHHPKFPQKTNFNYSFSREKVLCFSKEIRFSILQRIFFSYR